MKNNFINPSDFKSLYAPVLFIALAFFTAGSGSCFKRQEPVVVPVFDSIPQQNLLNASLTEISGIAASNKYPATNWGIEDSGNPPVVHLLSHQGSIIYSSYIKGATNRDWEAMAIAENDVFIAETGDNALQYSEYAIYKFPEPVNLGDTIFNAEKIRFVYPDGAHDCEAMFVDAATKDIYLITKNSNPSKIFRIAFPYSSGVQTAIAEGTLSFGGVVSADISQAQNEILVKTYTTVSYFKRNSGETILQALQKTPVRLAHMLEPQGEAVGFTRDNTGYYTISEKAFANQVFVNFYKRL
jgi:hypothetical protein